MIGSDPRYQAIIDAYQTGEFNPYYQQPGYNIMPTPYYNPIYDIRREQIKAGELEEGARFPQPQIDTTPETPPASPEAPIDPCPPGYQLIDGVCQPDSMFEQGRGREQEFTGPKITDGIIEGFERALPAGLGPESGALNSMQMMALEEQYGPKVASAAGEINKKYGYRGVQIKKETDAEIDRLRKVYGDERIEQDYVLGDDGSYYRIVATSPTLGQLAGDIGGALGSMAAGAGDFLMGGGVLGSLISGLIPQPPTVTTGGTSDISVREFGPTAPVVPINIEPLASITQPTVPGALDSTMRLQQEQQQAALLAQQQAAAEAERLRQLDIQRKAEAAAQAEKLRQQQALAAELERQRQAQIAAEAERIRLVQQQEKEAARQAALQEAERIRRLEQQRQEEAQRRAQQAAAEAARQRQAEIRAAEERARQAQQSGGTPRQGTGASGPPGRSGGSSRTERAAPRQVNIRSSAYSGRGYTRGR